MIVSQVTIQKEVQAGAVLQQVFVAEFVVEDHFCDSCTRVAANPDQWVAVVQVRGTGDCRVVSGTTSVQGLGRKAPTDGLRATYAREWQPTRTSGWLRYSLYRTGEEGEQASD